MNYLSKDNVQEIFGLSPLQEQILHQPEPETCMIQSAITIHGSLNHDHLQQAVNAMVKQHEALRTIFRQAKQRQLQVVLKEYFLHIDFVDVQNTPDTEEQVHTLLNQQRKAFILTDGPLVRLTCLQRTAHTFVLLCTAHQLVMDQSSLRVFLNELFTIYTTLQQGQALSEEKAPAFHEYLHWFVQQDWSIARAYWQEMIANHEPIEASALFAFERDTPLSTNRDHTLFTHTQYVPPLLCRQLEHLAQDFNISVEALITAAWAIIHTYSGEETALFGVEYDGRPPTLANATQIIGCLRQILPQQITIGGEEPIQTFCQKLYEQQKQSAHYSYIPPVELQRHNGTQTHTPFFHSSLAIYQPLSLPHASGLQREREEYYLPQSTLCHLQVTLTEHWQFQLTYTEQIGSQALGPRLLNYLQTVLESMTQTPHGTIAALHLLPEAERHFLFPTQEEPPSIPTSNVCVHHIIETQVAATPEAIAAIFNDQSITYSALNAQANQLAYWLQDQKVQRDDLVAIFAERSIDMLISILAILKSGAAYVPLDPGSPDQRVASILAQTSAKVILTHTDLAERCQTLNAALPQPAILLCIDQQEHHTEIPQRGIVATYPTIDLPTSNKATDLANVFFTSGSTGQPKGAMIEHQGMLNHIQAKIEILRLDQECIVAQNASHCFDISVWQFLAPLMVGGKVIIYENDIAGDPIALLDRLQQDKVTTLELVPTMIKLLLEVAEDQAITNTALPHVRYLISTGEALSIALSRKWLTTYAHIPIVNAYGATECSDDTTHAIIHTPPPVEQTYMSVGTPIRHFRAYVVNRWLQPLPLGCTGEICFTGIGVGRGYLRDAKKTAQAFLRNPFKDGMGSRLYRTGDLGYFLPDGQLVFAGRRDSQVKIRGNRIELGEVEAAILRHPFVAQCVVMAQQTQEEQHILVAYIIAHTTTDKGTIQEFLDNQLPDYMHPEHILFMDSFPLDANGKIKRKALPQPEHTVLPVQDVCAPRTKTEQKLYAIWQDILERDIFSVTDDFFRLGGQSLKIIQVRSRIKQYWQLDIPLRTLFTHATIEQVANVIDHALETYHQNQHKAITRCEDRPSYPLSHAQKRLWFLHHLYPANCLYNMPVAYELHGTLQEQALYQALQTLIQRHESLRTTFHLAADQAVQSIQAEIPFPLTYHDFSHSEPETQQEEVYRFLQQESKTSFNLVTGPLFRVHLIKLHAQQHFLVLNMHHIISDAWSWGIFERELSALYQAYRQGQSSHLSSLPIRYIDYAQWQSERMHDGSLLKDEQYWLQQFSEESTPLNLPTDHTRPNNPTYEGGSEHILFDQEVIEACRQLCAQTNSTIFIALLAATSIFLQHLTDQDDMVLGIPASNRNQLECEHIIGFFINTLPIRLQVPPQSTFIDWLNRVQTITLNAYEHQEYPFDALVERLNPERGNNRQPLFSVMFQVDKQESGLQLDGLSVTPHAMQNQQQAQFDFAISFVETETTLTAAIEYTLDLFTPETIKRFASYLKTLLHQLLMQPQKPLTEISLLSREEHYQQVHNWNQTAVLYPQKQSIHELFETRAAQCEENIAVIDQYESLTFQQLNDEANRLAHRLRAMGVTADTPVGIHLPRSATMIIALLAILKAGGAYVPLDPQFPQERLLWMIQDTHMPFLLTESTLPLGQRELTNTYVLNIDQERELIAQESATNLTSITHPQHLAYILYTSGSTGQPKGVMVTQQGLCNYLNWTIATYTPPIGLRAPVHTSLSVDITATSIFVPLLTGQSIHLLPETQWIEALTTFLQQDKAPSFITVSTSHLKLLNRVLQPTDIAGLASTILVGSEHVSGDVLPFWQTYAPDTRLINEYGPTETVIGCSTYEVSVDTVHDAVPIGKPIANTQIYILDRSLQPVPPGIPGEIYIGGAGLARGYLNDPKQTAEKFIPNLFSLQPGARLYRTGDRGKYLPDGNIVFLGRSDQQVKLRGQRIELNEITMTLKQHITLADATVQLHTSPNMDDTHLVAYVIGKAHAHVTHDELRIFLNERLAPYMVPRFFVTVDAFPLTPSGKIDTKRLPQPQHTPEEAAHYTHQGSIEQRMCQIWQHVLQVRGIRNTDNFFTLGGHSLLAITLLHHIEQHFGARLPLSIFFHHPTVRDVCDYLRTHITTHMSSLQLLQQGATSTIPLILVHAQGGGLLSYQHLLQALTNLTIYGLEAPGYTQDEEPLWSIQELAERYTQEICTHLPHHKSYALAGWSFGGAVVFEIARLLEQQGKTVHFLGLLDTAAFGQQYSHEQPFIEHSLPAIATRFLEMKSSDFLGLTAEQQLARIYQREQELDMLPQGASFDSMRRQAAIMLINQAAHETYTWHHPIHTDITLFCAIEEHPEKRQERVRPSQWTERTTGRVTVYEVPGNHYSFLELPHVSVLAEHIQRLLTVSQKPEIIAASTQAYHVQEGTRS